ncbi:hypothetical protein SRHO_G00196520 [Serrasalmus rhombeus]
MPNAIPSSITIGKYVVKLLLKFPHFFFSLHYRNTHGYLARELDVKRGPRKGDLSTFSFTEDRETGNIQKQADQPVTCCCQYLWLGPL